METAIRGGWPVAGFCNMQYTISGPPCNCEGTHGSPAGGGGDGGCCGTPSDSGFDGEISMGKTPSRSLGAFFLARQRGGMTHAGPGGCSTPLMR